MAYLYRFHHQLRRRAVYRRVSTSGTAAFSAVRAAFSGAGAETISGAGAFSAQHATLSGAGAETISGTGAFSAAHATFSGTSAETISGSGGITVVAAFLSGSGDFTSATPAVRGGGGGHHGELPPQPPRRKVYIPGRIYGDGEFSGLPAAFSGVGSVINPITGTGSFESPASAYGIGRGHYAPAPISGAGHFRVSTPRIRLAALGSVDNSRSFEAEDDEALALLEIY